jgi:hypothetical protein
VKSYEIGSTVYVRNYGQFGSKWVKGKVVEKLSPYVYGISVNGSWWKRHIDQISGAAMHEEHDQGHDRRPSDTWITGTIESEANEQYYDALQPQPEPEPQVVRYNLRQGRRPVERLGQ